MNQALKDLGVNVIAMTKANFSAAAKKAPTGSSFTRCVWDVKYGNVDLCIGDFWSTPGLTRIELSQPITAKKSHF